MTRLWGFGSGPGVETPGCTSETRLRGLNQGLVREGGLRSHRPGFQPRGIRAVFLMASTLLLTGCARDGSFQAISMWNQSRIKPLEESPMPDVPSSSRQLVPGTSVPVADGVDVGIAGG